MRSIFWLSDEINQISLLYWGSSSFALDPHPEKYQQNNQVPRCLVFVFQKSRLPVGVYCQSVHVSETLPFSFLFILRQENNEFYQRHIRGIQAVNVVFCGGKLKNL